MCLSARLLCASRGEWGAGSWTSRHKAGLGKTKGELQNVADLHSSDGVVHMDALPDLEVNAHASEGREDIREEDDAIRPERPPGLERDLCLPHKCNVNAGAQHHQNTKLYQESKHKLAAGATRLLKRLLDFPVLQGAFAESKRGQTCARTDLLEFF